MITASHLPFHRNGIKFFTKEGGLEKAQIREILLRAAKLEAEEVLATGTGLSPRPRCFDLITLYAANLANAIRKEIGFEPAPLPVVVEVEDETAPITRLPQDGSDLSDDMALTEEVGESEESVAKEENSKAETTTKPLAGLHIVVDAGNGAGGFFVTKILDELGADTTGSQFLDPDGMFPNHEPNPENKEAMAAIVAATLENQADLGLIFDTDVDRMSAVLSDGTPLNRDAIIAMMAAILAPENPGSTIITDSVTSDRLTDFLENDLGLKHLCFKRGYKNVIDKCKELNAAGTNSPLAMETSGHGCLKENYYLDDGAYLAVKLIAAVAKAKEKGETIDHLIASLVMECADREVRFKILEEDFGAYGTKVLARFKEKAEENGCTLPLAYEGVRIRFDDDPTGWLLLRASLHDPVMVLNMEGKDEADLAKITGIVKELHAGEEGLDLSSL
ncbi:MAG: phosphomannomutase/phosphoglucomutase [Eubacterium sp.]|nr:phosphomannomutase/phosphoglucomutase [Eubacterium sp.]